MKAPREPVMMPRHEYICNPRTQGYGLPGTAMTTPRSNAPVFVLGCSRSGTTLLYHMLLSAGNFAINRAESAVLNLLEPRFGDLTFLKTAASVVLDSLGLNAITRHLDQIGEGDPKPGEYALIDQGEGDWSRHPVFAEAV